MRYSTFIQIVLVWCLDFLSVAPWRTWRHSKCLGVADFLNFRVKIAAKFVICEQANSMVVTG